MQAYFIFSIGNIRPLITAEYPFCWKYYETCDKTLTQAPDYTQIIGAAPLMLLSGLPSPPHSFA